MTAHPLYNRTAEEIVCAGLLVYDPDDPSPLRAVRREVSPEHFWITEHRALYAAELRASVRHGAVCLPFVEEVDPSVTDTAAELMARHWLSWPTMTLPAIVECARIVAEHADRRKRVQRHAARVAAESRR